MPKSKRNKVISLTKVKKKPKSAKENLIEEIQAASQKFKHAFALSLENQRNNFLKEVRMRFKASKMFCGKNKVMQHALGMTPETECQDSIHKLARKLVGPTALLFTNETNAKVQEYFAGYKPVDFARTGGIATEKVVLERGTEALAHMAHSQEAHLRAIGLP